MSNRRSAPPVTLSVDMIRCDGHGICAWLFPERIRLDRWGYPVIDPAAVPDEDQRRALRAVRACPRGALSAAAAQDVRPSATVQP